MALNKNPGSLRNGHLVASFKENQAVGTAVFASQEIADRLLQFVLPEDSPLTVMVVEVFGNPVHSFWNVILLVSLSVFVVKRPSAD